MSKLTPKRRSGAKMIEEDFELEDASIVVNKNKEYQDTREESNLDKALDSVTDMEVPVNPNTVKEEHLEKTLNLNAIKSLNEMQEAVRQSEGLFLEGSADEYKEDDDPEEGFDLFKEHEEQDEDDINLVPDEISETDIHIDASIKTNEEEELKEGLDLFKEDMSMEDLGGSEALNNKVQNFNQEVVSDTEEDTFEENIYEVGTNMESISEINIPVDEEEINESYQQIEDSLLGTANALKEIKELKPEQEALKNQRMASTLTEEELQDIEGNIDLKELAYTEARIYDIPEDIKTMYLDNHQEVDHTEKQIAVNMMDIDLMLENIADTVKPTTSILVNRRKISQALLHELVKTGRHYVKAEEIYPASIPTGVEIIQKGNVTYYAYVHIPSQYTGYREPFKNFIKSLKENIQKDLMNKGRTELDLIDENSINILTVNEYKAVVKFLNNLDLYYKVEHNKLIITC